MEEEKSFNLKEWVEKNTVIALICALVLGLLLGAAVMYCTGGMGKVASVKGGTLTEKKLYNKMKDYYSINLVLEEVDKTILNKKYNITDEERKDIKKQANSYIEQYANYGYSKEEFLQENGFKDYEEFLDYLITDYKRSLYVYDYIEKQLEENAVKNYYDEHSFGTVNTKHILVKTDQDLSDEKALELAKEIITKLDAGEDFDTVAEEYVEKYKDTVITEDLGEMSAFSGLEDGYVEGMKKLNAGEHSTEPVETSYGYHVIYCVDKKDKTDEISVKDRIKIIQVLSTDITQNNSNIYYEALIKMREEAKLKFYDKDLKEKYEEYCLQYVSEETTGEVTEEATIDLTEETEEAEETDDNE